VAASRTFDYEVRDLVGETTKGRLAAPDEEALIRQLRTMGYVPMSVREVGKGINRELALFGGGGKIKMKDLAVMCRQLATMIGAGLPLLTTLSVLAEQTETRPLQDALRVVSKDIQGGLSLSGAMGKQPKVFPVLLVNLCHAGEMGGFLDKSLTRVAATFESEVQLRGKVKAAMVYPVVVLVICLFATIGMLLFIVPVFEKMYEDLGGTLPAPTRILVALSDRMIWIVPLGIALTVLGATVWKKIKTKPEVRLKVDTIKLKIPVFGRLFTKVAISRFSRNLGTMLASGVPVLTALDVVSESTGNAVLTKAIRDIQTGVRQGASIAARMENHEIFPPMVVNLLSVGEDTGQMESMLDKIADSYDDEVAAMTEGLTAMLEPLLIVVLAAIVGTMIIALYMPMFSIFNEIQ
jgi:type IV pilus assembly protein PilC